MASASSSKTSLSRTQTRTDSIGSSRRPRPRSPPSMYVAYETSMAKPPKPLIKLDKKQKGKAKAAPDPPNPFPVRSNSLFAPPPTTVREPPSRRPSVGSFLSLRRKKHEGSSPSLPARDEFPNPRPRAPPLHTDRLHEPNVHPVGDLEPISRRSDKANRLLGDPVPFERASTAPAPTRHDVGAPDPSDAFGISPLSSTSSLGGGSFDDECFADDSHIQRESTLLSPMEFPSRPPSVPVFAPAAESDTASEIDGSWVDDEPITPVGALPPKHGRTDVLDPRDSYASVHDYYSHSHSHSRGPSAHQEYRPDTPFMDTIVAVNSPVLVAGVPRRHGREPSVIRSEPKEGWMGEWNQGDMHDVINKLRSLK
ncbi:hypothetical protein DFH07DRAFT_973665 [Mycena maculata]|uniref:Uncharacterized protein n=1 Tax=Mycena maculata TaxID=230809 RepID=A0AAD7MH45_9AGAR|nr:hypothetical protein DFH07DRAFT_973665 [Mycena maculata]